MAVQNLVPRNTYNFLVCGYINDNIDEPAINQTSTFLTGKFFNATYYVASENETYLKIFLYRINLIYN